MFEEKEKFKSRLDKNFGKVKAVRKKKNFREIREFIEEKIAEEVVKEVVKEVAESVSKN